MLFCHLLFIHRLLSLRQWMEKVSLVFPKSPCVYVFLWLGPCYSACQVICCQVCKQPCVSLFSCYNPCFDTTRGWRRAHRHTRLINVVPLMCGKHTNIPKSQILSFNREKLHAYNDAEAKKQKAQVLSAFKLTLNQTTKL